MDATDEKMDATTTQPRQYAETNSIECECGPVYVNAEMEASCTALDGTVDPNTNNQDSLWQVRYVAHANKETAYRFYVNEALRTARSSPPKRPQSCSGGILADAMGLGKVRCTACCGDRVVVVVL